MWNSFWDWLDTSGLKILIIIGLTWLIERSIKTIIAQVIHRSINPDNYSSEREEHLREQTIVSLVSAIARVVLVVIAFILILGEFDIDIGTLLAGAGVIGFAIGFGAQNLIKDFIAGIFVVLENQYRVGDVVRLNGVSGQVKKITTRITVLRDLDGNVHYIPNGSIEMSTNMTMEYAKINLEIGVSYDSDLDKVKQVVDEVGLALAEDKVWKEFVTEAPYFARVNDFGDSAIIIKIFGKTLPAKQWSVEGELRKRLKTAFDENQIVIPFPQRVIHQAKR